MTAPPATHSNPQHHRPAQPASGLVTPAAGAQAFLHDFILACVIRQPLDIQKFPSVSYNPQGRMGWSNKQTSLINICIFNNVPCRITVIMLNRLIIKGFFGVFSAIISHIVKWAHLSMWANVGSSWLAPRRSKVIVVQAVDLMDYAYHRVASLSIRAARRPIRSAPANRHTPGGASDFSGGLAQRGKQCICERFVRSWCGNVTCVAFGD